MIDLPPFTPQYPSDKEILEICKESLEVLRSDVLFSNEKVRRQLRRLTLEEKDKVETRMNYPQRKGRPVFNPYRGNLTPEELAYYGSELNREIYLRSFSLKDPPDRGFTNIPEKLQRLGRVPTSKDQSSGNIDLASVKEDLQRIQIVESKHLSEGEPSRGQRKIFGAIARAFVEMNNRRTPDNPWQYEFYMIRADYPYTGGLIRNMLHGSQSPYIEISEQELFDLLSFRIQFGEIKKKERK